MNKYVKREEVKRRKGKIERERELGKSEKTKIEL